LYDQRNARKQLILQFKSGTIGYWLDEYRRTLLANRGKIQLMVDVYK
jgi:hypothetical protein